MSKIVPLSHPTGPAGDDAIIPLASPNNNANIPMGFGVDLVPIQEATSAAITTSIPQVTPVAAPGSTDNDSGSTPLSTTTSPANTANPIDTPTEANRPIHVVAAGTNPAHIANLLDRITELFQEVRSPSKIPILAPTTAGANIEAELKTLESRIIRPISPYVDVILRTSGSTCVNGHLVGLSKDALRSSCQSTEIALGGPGRWILALPANHIAGFMVLVRSVLADTRPIIVDTSKGFDPHGLVRAINRTRANRENGTADATGRTYLSLVPTQLLTCLTAGPQVVAALRSLTRVLIGGASVDPSILDAARNCGIAVTTTYGMTETCGGCVYDGIPLAGTRVAAIADHIWISGTTLMEGYLDAPGTEDFNLVNSRRWLRTADLGRMMGPRLIVEGRSDDTINTGGVKVQAAIVEQTIATSPYISQACVVGVPDRRWGSQVTALVVTSPLAAPELVNPLRQLCGLPIIAPTSVFPGQDKTPQTTPRSTARTADSLIPQGSSRRQLPASDQTPAQTPEESPALSPIDAAIAAMQARLRGEDVDIAEAARSGRLQPVHQPILDQDEDKTPAPDPDPGPTPVPAAPELNWSVAQQKLAESIRAHVIAELGHAHAPRAIIIVDSLPLLPSGKIDRLSAQELAAQASVRGQAWIH